MEESLIFLQFSFANRFYKDASEEDSANESLKGKNILGIVSLNYLLFFTIEFSGKSEDKDRFFFRIIVFLPNVIPLIFII